MQKYSFFFINPNNRQTGVFSKISYEIINHRFLFLILENIT